MKIISCLLFTFLYVSVSAQTKTMKQYEDTLISIFYEDQKYVNNPDPRPQGNENIRGTFRRFKNELKMVLLMHESIDYPFDSLSQLINLHQSTDKRFRSLSWYAGGGTGSTFDQVFQYVTTADKIFVQETGDEDGDFNNTYYRLEQLNIQKKPVYFVFGWSSGGGGSYCRCVKAFEIKGKKLLPANVFKDTSAVLSEIITCQPRMYKNDLKFDPVKNEFSYDLYRTDDETGFPLKTKSKIYWTLTGEKFIKLTE